MSKSKFSITIGTSVIFAILIVFQNMQIVRAGYKTAQIDRKNKKIETKLEKARDRIKDILSKEAIALKVLELNIPVSRPRDNRREYYRIENLLSIKRDAADVASSED